MAKCSLLKIGKMARGTKIQEVTAGPIGFKAYSGSPDNPQFVHQPSGDNKSEQTAG